MKVASRPAFSFFCFFPILESFLFDPIFEWLAALMDFCFGLPFTRFPIFPFLLVQLVWMKKSVSYDCDLDKTSLQLFCFFGRNIVELKSGLQNWEWYRIHVLRGFRVSSSSKLEIEKNHCNFVGSCDWVMSRNLGALLRAESVSPKFLSRIFRRGLNRINKNCNILSIDFLV